MACDCPQILTNIQNAQAQILVYETAESVAHQHKIAWQQTLWYEQYNFYLCGCGGQGMMTAEQNKAVAAKRKETEKAILGRTDQELAVMRDNEPLYRLHQLCVSMIEGKA